MNAEEQRLIDARQAAQTTKYHYMNIIDMFASYIDFRVMLASSCMLDPHRGKNITILADGVEIYASYCPSEQKIYQLFIGIITEDKQRFDNVISNNMRRVEIAGGGCVWSLIFIIGPDSIYILNEPTLDLNQASIALKHIFDYIINSLPKQIETIYLGNVYAGSKDKVELLEKLGFNFKKEGTGCLLGEVKMANLNFLSAEEPYSTSYTSNVCKVVPDYRADAIMQNGFGIFVRGEDGTPLGGVYCDINTTIDPTWLYVRYLWLDKSIRGRKLPSLLLKHAEDHARDNLGCKTSGTATLSFQAPKLYPRLGYEQTTQHSYAEHTQYHFIKPLL